ncbi:ABC transporter permease/substrate-binding protein [Runella slithyformis]|uniref:ABC-type transporter, integral membrane subunit n=1 Tax=Runella slithyformis (strain ATCC 29530 / DSM 19594 / LMG 11500 / NCIMB 11436 / LSU 4) TaxID=761193 RepID=A0A7U3ZMM7_RUNSL|nr:substrate-binding domain-containing protein [Runella slithyformis]AEI49999.1 ABC-type transporter, integral membrane subunit [Runella slithyformis DSM 19594]
MKYLQDRIFTLSVLIVLVCIGASMAFPQQFPTFENFSQILLNVSIETIVAVGMMVLMITGVFDLSVGSVVALSGGLAAYLMVNMGISMPVAVLAGVLASLAVGWVNGYFIAKVGINPLIQTLATMGMVRGLALMIAGAGIQNLPYEFIYIGQSKLLKIQSPVWWMLAVVLIFHLLTTRTVFFRRYYYIGGNEKAADLSGIRVRKMKHYAFILSALLAGIAGILIASRLGSAIASIGKGMELRVITAVILGGASLAGGQGRIVGALLGTVFMGIISNVMVLSRVSGYWQEIILGAILIVAIWFDIVLKGPLMQQRLRSKGGVLKKVLILFPLWVAGGWALSSCEGPPRDTTAAESTAVNEADYAMTEATADEEYVMVTAATSLPLFVTHDQAAFRAWGKARGVKVSIVGPTDWNVPAQIEAIEQVIATKPAGMLINGTDLGIANAINKAVEAGIPTVVYDSEIPSKRHCFLGSDWYQMGLKQGEAIVKLANGKKGKVACVGILGQSNQEEGFRGLQEALKKHPNLQFLGKFETHNSTEETARVTSDLISSYPDLVAIAGFTSETGPGIGLGIKEMNRVGKVIGTNVDAGPILLKLLKEGVLQLLVEQKRETFVWYGAQFLFDMVHNVNAFPKNYIQAGSHALPYSVNTGIIEINKDNVDNFIK